MDVSKEREQDAEALLETRNVWSVSEHALHGPKDSGHGWLLYKEVTRQRGETNI
ncbi:MAG: hypothetical protein ACN4GM_00535 [Gammaproteobacteria bacterium]